MGILAGVSQAVVVLGWLGLLVSLEVLAGWDNHFQGVSSHGKLLL